MKFHVIFIVTFSALSAAFTLPDNLTDGTYTAYYNETGHEVHIRSEKEPLPALLEGLGINGSSIHKRQRRHGDMYCGPCDKKVNRADREAVQDAMIRAGVMIMKPRTAKYFIRGTVLGFVCVFPSKMKTIDVQGQDDYLKQLEGFCPEHPATVAQGADSIESIPHDVGWTNVKDSMIICMRARAQPVMRPCRKRSSV